MIKTKKMLTLPEEVIKYYEAQSAKLNKAISSNQLMTIDLMNIVSRKKFPEVKDEQDDNTPTLITE